ncbi:hypothetical protein H5399_12780 [Tessaracoccus sp. MC1627]|uniref:hypothetical protein n=1 Tax=Tessaracoccus sp. MC1627 TaxID=2760312 RepID=UPI0016034407|nr:hypothetical protein [Tessaracoccus sp. MC1627]MBB1513198.1 hypothetical protein [Tessaracoccus sp. MC1627]MBB1513469.1 hypothetical protein [Tessaracoccus sp. MC1627]
MSIRSRLLDVARQMKHVGFVAAKRGKIAARSVKFGAATVAAGPYSKTRPYAFKRERYRRTFLFREPPQLNHPSELPRRILVAWTGANQLTPNRARNLARMRETVGLPVELVTPDNLRDWVVDGHPIHPAYEHLSLVHRSDYLQAYLMHHHGGGYSGIKAPLHSWGEAYRRAAADPDAWLTGYTELTAASVVRLAGPLGFDVAMHHPRLVGLGAMFVRSYTPLTAEWLREVERRMDYYGPQAAEYPGGIRGEPQGYPVSWTRLLGGVLHPLQLKYLSHVRQDDDLLLDFQDYQ